MTPRIRTIKTPNNVIGQIPESIVSEVNIPPPFRPTIPVTRGIGPPVVDMPEYEWEYPELDGQQVEEYQEQMDPTPPIPPIESPERPETPQQDTRDLSNNPTITQPIIEVGGMDIPLPEAAPIVAASTMAIATTMAALGSTVLVTQAKMALDPILKKAAARHNAKKKKVKIKKTKTVLHFILDDESGHVEILEYSDKGVKIVGNDIENLEQYLRDKIEEYSFYEYDNKLIIDEILKEGFSREGAQRFKQHFVKPKIIAKKLGAKFAF